VNISQPKLRSEKFDDNDNNNNKFLDSHVILVAGVLRFCTEMQKKTNKKQ
jgi:hypothetical protein